MKGTYFLVVPALALSVLFLRAIFVSGADQRILALFQTLWIRLMDRSGPGPNTASDRERYSELCQGRLNSELRDSRREQLAERREVQRLQAQLIAQLGGGNCPNGALTKVRELTDVMYALRIGSVLLVLTGPLSAKDARSKGQRRIGRFLVTLNLQNGSVRWRNLTFRPQVPGSNERIHAPNVDGSGFARAARLYELSPSLLATGEIVGLVKLSLDLVRIVKPEELGMDLMDLFPLREE